MERKLPASKPSPRGRFWRVVVARLPQDLGGAFAYFDAAELWLRRLMVAPRHCAARNFRASLCVRVGLRADGAGRHAAGQYVVDGTIQNLPRGEGFRGGRRRETCLR